MSDWQRNALRKALDEFGDLSGIVLNVRTEQLVGGHQRVEQFKVLDGKTKVVVTQRFKKPTKRGTVAHGYVELDGEQYNYREVDWSEKREIKANIAANQHGGEFDQDELAVLIKESGLEGEGESLGFDNHELEQLLKTEGTSSEFGRPRVTDDDYSLFELVMLHENKLKLVAKLDAIRKSEKLVKLEDALMWLCDRP